MRHLPTHRGAAVLFALAVIALLWPVLLGGRALTPASLLYFSPPWTTAKPDDVLTYFNPVLSDIPTAYYPWWTYAREALHDGVLPQWNPYALAGTPFFANPQSALLSPFSLILWILPLDYALGVLAGVQLWLMAFGTYVLARGLGLSFGPALLAGVILGFSPFAIVWLTYPLLSVLALLPWSLWLVERIVRRGRPGDALALGLVLAVALLAGHPGSQLHLFAVVASYGVVRILLRRGLPRRDRLMRAGLGVVALGLGAAIAAVVLLPVALTIPGTVGVEVRSGGGLILPRDAMRTIFFPDWWGRPNDVYFPAPANYNEGTLYAGTVALVLAVLALLTRDRLSLKLPYALLAFVGFQAAFGLQPTQWILEHAPLLKSDRNARLSLLVQLAAAILAAFALQRLLEPPRPIRRVVAVCAGAMLVGVLGLVAAEPSFHELRVVGNHFRTGNDYALPDVVQAISVAWWLLLAVTLSLVLLVLPRFHAGASMVVATVVLLAAVDAAHFARGYNPMAPAEHAFPSPPAAVEFLAERAGTERLAGVGITLPPDTSTVYELRDVRGNDPPRPELRFMRLFRLVNPRQPTGDWLAIPSLDARGKRVLDALNVRWIIFPPGSPSPSLPNLVPAYSGADADIYRSSSAVPRAFVPARVRAAASEQEILGRMAAPGFDARRLALVEGAAPPAGRGSVRVTRDSASVVELETELERGGLVVLSDSLDDGWSVEIDGEGADVVRVDSVLRGVDVPAGTHAVRWSYRTPGLVPGAVVSAAALGAAVAWAALLYRRRRQSRAASA